ncbi:hypothetical protein DMENIID0001_144910 [Sergentomyia squamirostris]
MSGSTNTKDEDHYTKVYKEIDRFFKIKPITKPTACKFWSMTATVNSVLDNLNAMNATSIDPWLIYILLKKLDPETRYLWAMEKDEAKHTLKGFFEFLDHRIKSLELLEVFKTD